MRITRLLLHRYGHLSDVAIEFPDRAGLNIVLGENEAGKSTALAAIGDALFGFPDRTPYAFLHERRDLRVGIELQAADGRSGFFFRRKGRQDTLTDEAGDKLPDTAISAFLAGAGRERFAEMFGLDGAELRRGGAAILEFKGEVGQSLVQAFSRRQNARGALSGLNQAALLLYGDRRGGRAFHAAAERFRTARQDLDERSVRPAEYGSAVAERDACAAARAAHGAELQRLDAERVRLDRIRRTWPARMALQRYRETLAALGEVRPMPADAEARRSAAIQAREVSARAIERETAAQAADAAALHGLVVDAALLAQGHAIDALVADLNRIHEAARDREALRVVAAEARAHVEEAGRRLGLAGDAESLVARMPGELARAAAERAILDFTRLATRLQDSAAEWERVSAVAEEARLMLEGSPAPGSAEALIAAIDTARAAGDIDAQLAEAVAAREEADKRVAAALRTLPFWQGTANQLAACALPLGSTVMTAEAALASAAAELAERRREETALDRALQNLMAEKTGLLATGMPPTAAAVADARARRDRAWSLIRRQHIDGGAAPSAAELDGLPAKLAEALSPLMAEADALADRRAAEAERVAAYEHCLAGIARTTALLEQARAACAGAAFRLQGEEAAWVALWHPAGVMPGDPAAMREWRADRERLLEYQRDAAQKAASVTRLRARQEVARGALAGVLPQEAASAQPEVAPWLRAAGRVLQAHETAARRHAEAARAVADAGRALAAAGRKRDQAAEEMAAWRAGWGPVAATLGLPARAGAEAGADALGIWAGLDRHAAKWREAQARVDAITAAVEAFAAGAAACAAACAADLLGERPEAAVRAMAARLAASRAAEASRLELHGRMENRQAELGRLTAEHAAAEDILQALRKLADAADDAALLDAIARARATDELAQNIAAREAELRRLDDGLSADDLAREAAGEVPDTLPGRIADIDERRRAIALENEALARTLLEVEARIAAMERGQDAAGAAQRMQDAAAEAEEIAERYVRLRLSHTLLRAGIDKFRREQQAPLLASAGALFAELTGGRYARLATDEEDDGRVIVVAARPDGTHCPADRLSEGTRDQLYLALRLAAIGLHAAHAEPLPFIADDLLASFDDRRAKAALGVLEKFGRTTQTILFTHHEHIAAMADPATMLVHRLQ